MHNEFSKFRGPSGNRVCLHKGRRLVFTLFQPPSAARRFFSIGFLLFQLRPASISSLADFGSLNLPLPRFIAIAIEIRPPAAGTPITPHIIHQRTPDNANSLVSHFELHELHKRRGQRPDITNNQISPTTEQASYLSSSIPRVEARHGEVSRQNVHQTPGRRSHRRWKGYHRI